MIHVSMYSLGPCSCPQMLCFHNVASWFSMIIEHSLSNVCDRIRWDTFRGRSVDQKRRCNKTQSFLRCTNFYSYTRKRICYHLFSLGVAYLFRKCTKLYTSTKSKGSIIRNNCRACSCKWAFLILDQLQKFLTVVDQPLGKFVQKYLLSIVSYIKFSPEWPPSRR